MHPIEIIKYRSFLGKALSIYIEFPSVVKNSEYDQEIPQSQTATPWHRQEELLNHHETPGRQIK